MKIIPFDKKRSWEKSFLIITIGQTISLIGSSAVQFSLIWWIASETASPLMLSLSGLLALLPQLFLGPFAGVWIDRLKRKTVIICADLFTGIVATMFAIFFLFGNPPFWSACVVLGIRAVAGVFQTPATQSIIPMLVPKQQLVRANGWSQFMQSGSLMLGPVIGAAMYAALPIPVILLSDLVGAVAASATILIVKIPELKSEQQQGLNLIKEIKEGIYIFYKDKKLCIVTLAAAICMIFYMPLSSFLPLMTSSYFHATAWYASIVQFGYAGGMMICSVLAGAYGIKKDKLLVVHIGLLGIGLGAFFCGILPKNSMAFWAFAILCTIIGASGNLYNIPYVAYMQETIPHGLNVHGVVFDELHAQPNRQLYDVMTTGSGDARRQPLYFLITTAGTDRHSICWEVHQKAEDILQGRKVDPTFYPVIYGAPDDADWMSEKVWKQVNPSLGITVNIEKLRVACENAKANPAEENLFRQLRLNQWVKQSVRWMPMEKWDKCALRRVMLS